LDGVPCIFPFIYKGETFTKCTWTDADGSWCSTNPDGTATDDGEDDLWGYCDYESDLCESDDE